VSDPSTPQIRLLRQNDRMTGLTAFASTTIDASKDRIWEAVTDPTEVKQWFFGTELKTDWQPGSSITWSGEWEGKPYQDKGEVVAVDEPNRLEMTHYSPLTGQEDKPENYHTIVYALTEATDGGTELTLTQDNNGDQDEADRNADTWSQMLAALKSYVEGG
jgi:uncharacterized protein YndB with AHSA1/START domain